MKTRYLGIVLTNTGETDEEVKEQINKANRIAGCLTHSIWYNKQLRQETKVRIYKSVIRPVLTYSVETRSETAKIRQRMGAPEMRVLRKIAGKILKDRVRN